MKVKVIKHQVRDNLFVVSSDIYKMLEQKREPHDFLKNIFDNKAEIVEDRWLPNMTVVTPDREYFDKKIDEFVWKADWFAETYLRD